MPLRSPTRERQFAIWLDTRDKRAFIARRSRRLVHLATVGTAAEEVIAAHRDPLPSVLRPVLLNPAQLARKVNGAVARLNRGLIFVIEYLAQAPLLGWRKSPHFFNDSFYICGRQGLLLLASEALLVESGI
jgi:hypothetical protein